MSTEPMTQNPSEQHDPTQEPVESEQATGPSVHGTTDEVFAVDENSPAGAISPSGDDSQDGENSQDSGGAGTKQQAEDDGERGSAVGADGEEGDATEGDTLDESTALTKEPRRSSRREDLEHEGEIAADFLESLLDIADLDGDLEVNVEADRAAVAIVDSEEGAAPKRLVGHGGEVLEALQELTRLAVQAETGDRSRLMLDVAGHRAGRRTELVQLAREESQKVKDSGQRRELDPMSAFERKVVHDEVLAAGLVSESEGTEPTRFVVILPPQD